MKNKLYVCALLFLSFTGCTDRNKHSVLNESEIFFSETLASISKDSNDDNLYYIGTEDGIIYKYNSETLYVDTLQTEFDRIYKVLKVKEGKDDIYWVGTRNMGLFRCEMKGDSLVMRKKNGRYYIPATGKATKYSAYDISAQTTGVYVATSHGLFKVPEKTAENDSTLVLLAPESYKSKPEALRPIVVGNIQKYEDQYLFCSSDSGLFRVELANDNIDKYLSNHKIRNVVVRQDGIFSLTGDSVIITDKDGKFQKSIKLKQAAQIYYYDEIEKINYFINDYLIQLVEDSNLYDSNSYKLARIKRPIRTSCHNIVVNDPRHRQSLLVTNHSISRVGHHQDIFNSYGNLKYVSMDKDNIYYLIDTKIYRQKSNEKTAYLYKDITGGTKDVCYMEVNDDVLYYVDSDNEIFKAKLYSNYLWNSMLSWDKKVEQNPKTKKAVTAIGKDRDNVYVGVRDGFRNINEINTDISLIGDTNKNYVPDPYITSFATNNDSTILGTLNDGIFIGRDNKFVRIPDTQKYAFIRDVKAISAGCDSLRVLTNRYIYDRYDSISIMLSKAQGYNKLLVLDSKRIFGVKNFGLTDFSSGTDYFVDIHFNVNACAAQDGKIYAGSSNGVYVFDSSISKKGNVEKGFYRVQFDQKDYFSRTNILVLTLLVFIVIVILWIYDRYRMSLRAIQTFKDGLMLRLDELNSVREYLDKEASLQLDNLFAEVESVDMADKKEALENLRKTSLKIMALTLKVPSILTQILQEQIIQIKNSGFDDANSYVKNTNEAIKAQTLLRLGSQIKTNAKMFSEIQETKEKIKACDLMFRHPLFRNVPINKTIETILATSVTSEEKLVELEKLIESLDKPAMKAEIKEYVNAKKDICNAIQNGLDEKSGNYIIADIIKSRCDAVIRSIETLSLYDTMQVVLDIDKRLKIIDMINSIKERLAEYDKLNDIYIKKEQYRKSQERIEASATGNIGSIQDTKEREELKTLKSDIRNIKSEIGKIINELYGELSNGSEKALLKIIELSLKIGGEEQFLQPTVLAILATGTGLPMRRLKNLLEVNEQSLRRVKRQLMQQLKMHRQEIEDYYDSGQSAFALLMLKILETYDE